MAPEQSAVAGLHDPEPGTGDRERARSVPSTAAGRIDRADEPTNAGADGREHDRHAAAHVQRDACLPELLLAPSGGDRERPSAGSGKRPGGGPGDIPLGQITSTAVSTSSTLVNNLTGAVSHVGSPTHTPSGRITSPWASTNTSWKQSTRRRFEYGRDQLPDRGEDGLRAWQCVRRGGSRADRHRQHAADPEWPRLALSGCA